MKKQKGQDLIEYAFLLALIVAVGAGIYSAGMTHSISNVFAQAGSLLGDASKKQLSAVSSYDDIIKRLGEGRYQGLADIGTCGYTEGDPRWPGSGYRSG